MPIPAHTRLVRRHAAAPHTARTTFSCCSRRTRCGWPSSAGTWWLPRRTAWTGRSESRRAARTSGWGRPAPAPTPQQPSVRATAPAPRADTSPRLGGGRGASRRAGEQARHLQRQQHEKGFSGLLQDVAQLRHVLHRQADAPAGGSRVAGSPRVAGLRGCRLLPRPAAAGARGGGPKGGLLRPAGSARQLLRNAASVLAP